MSQGRLIGDAYIAILPDLGAFQADMQTGIRRALAMTDARKAVHADTAPFLADFEAAKQAILASGDIKVIIGGDTSGLQLSMVKMLAQAELLRERLRSIPMTTDDHASILAARKLDQNFGPLLQQMQIWANTERGGRAVPQAAFDVMLAELAKVTAGVDALDTKLAHLDPHMDPAQAVNTLANMRVRVAGLGDQLAALKLDPNDLDGHLKVLRMMNEGMALAKELRGMKADMDPGPMEAKILALTIQARDLQKALSADEAPLSGTGRASAVTLLEVTDKAVRDLYRDISAMGSRATPSIRAVDAALAGVYGRIVELKDAGIANAGDAAKLKELAAEASQLASAWARVKPPPLEPPLSLTDWASAVTQLEATDAAIVKLSGDIGVLGDETTPSIRAVDKALADLYGRVEGLKFMGISSPGDVTRAKELAAEAGQLAAAYNRVKPPPLEPPLSKTDLASAAAQALATDAAIKKLAGDIKALGRGAGPEVRAVSAALADLKARSAALRAAGGITSPAAAAQVAVLAAELGKLDTAFGQAGGRAAKAAQGFGIFGRAIAAIGNTHIPLFASSMSRADKSLSTLNNGVLSLIPGMKGINNSFLFTASGVHILIEAVVEFAAVWGPALAGLTAFGIVARPLIKDIYGQLTNMKTVANATGQSFKIFGDNSKSIAGGLSQLQKDIMPSVLQLWGDYLTVASDKSDHFGGVLKSIGGVLDKFGAQLVNALNGKATHTFLSKAAEDVQGLGVAFEQIGRIIGTLLQSVPGYAELLLKVGDAALTMSANILQAIQPLLAKFLAFHGAIFYLGLASTILLTFGKAAVTAFTETVASSKAATIALGETAAAADAAAVSEDAAAAGGAKGLAKWGTAIGSFAGSIVAGTGKALTFAKALLGLGAAEGSAAAAWGTLGSALAGTAVALAIPAALAGIGYGIYEDIQAFNQAKGAVGDFNAALASIKTSSFENAEKNIATAAANTVQQINLLNQGIRNIASPNVPIGPKQVTPGKVASLVSQYDIAQLKTYGQLLAQVGTRNSALMTQYGSLANATTVAALANVNMNDVITKGDSAWATDTQQMLATAAAYGFMSEKTGLVNNQLNTLTITTGTTFQAMQNLASAEQNWISLITGGQSAFNAFVQGNITLGTQLGQVAQVATRTAGAGGKLVTTYHNVTSTMNGLDSASLTAQSTFLQQASAAGTLYGNLQMLAAAAGNTAAAQDHVQQAAKDAIGTLLQFADGSKGAQQTIIGLAQALGYSGPLTYAAIRAWTGYNGSAKSSTKATKDLNAQVSALTGSADNLAQAAKNLGSAMTQGIVNSQQQALLSSTKFYSIQNALISVLENSKGALTNSARLLAGEYYMAMTNAGYSTQQAAGATDALLTYLHVAPGDIQSVNTALGQMQSQANNTAGGLSGVVSQLHQIISNDNITVRINYVSTGNPYGNPVVKGQSVPHKAAGGIIKGGGPAGQDSVLAMLAPGELVIPASHAPAFQDAAKRAGVPGLAVGGMPGAGIADPFTPSQSPGGTFGENALSPLLNPAASAVTGPQTQPMTQVQGMLLIQLLQQLVKVGLQQPQQIGNVINAGTANAARRAHFPTGG